MENIQKIIRQIIDQATVEIIQEPYYPYMIRYRISNKYDKEIQKLYKILTESQLDRDDQP